MLTSNGNYWDDFADYALMVHRATPYFITRFSPFYLLHGRDMRMPNTDDLSAQIAAPRVETENKDKVGSHIKALAEKLEEAYDIGNGTKFGERSRNFSMTEIQN